MFRRWILPVLLILAAGVLGAWAIARKAADSLAPPAPRPLPGAEAPPATPKPPDREPPFLVVFGGELAGRFWIPPCSQFRQGGFPRVGPLLQEVVSQAPVSMILDLGDMIGAPGEAGAVEMESGLRAFNDLGLAVQAVGERDLLVGLDRWKEVRARAALGVAVLCANLRDDQGRPLVPGATPPMVAGRKKVVVAAVLSPSFEKGLRDAGVAVRIVDPVPALREALDAAGKADMILLLSHADPEETRRILREVPAVDVALAAHAGVLPWQAPEEVDGRVLMAGGSGWQFVNALILGDQGEGRRPRMGGVFNRGVRGSGPEDLGVKFMTGMALDRLRLPGLFEGALRESAALQSPDAPAYTGPGACASCHPAAHSRWKEDPHSRSMATVRERRFDVAWNCLSCHATAPGLRGGHAIPGDAQAAVTCEACHGPGAAHVAADGRVPLEGARDSCVRCHLPEMSPAFSFEEAWPKVVHGR